MYVNSSSHQLCLLACTPLFSSQGSPRRPPHPQLPGGQRWTEEGSWAAQAGRRGLGLLGVGETMALAFAVNGPGLWEACDPSSAFIFALVQEGFCREVLFQMHLGNLIFSEFRLWRGAGPSAQYLWTLYSLSTVSVSVSLDAFSACFYVWGLLRSL